MSQWDVLAMDVKIAIILNVRSHSRGHHFGRPFLTPYQIAIIFKRRFSHDFRTIGKQVGGRGIGSRDSLAQYIAMNLSRRIKNRKILNIEGRYLNRAHLKTLKYDDQGQSIESSSMTSYDLSIFRLCN